MRSIWKSVPSIGVLTLILANAANAADVGRLPPPPPLLQSAPLLVDEFGSGWYLRGDIGYRWNEVDEVTNTNTGRVLSSTTFDNSWLVGIGGGYKWDWFRTDVTLDYAQADFSRGQITANVQSITGLVNIYGDLGTWWGFTPYIGIGAGTARVEGKDFHVGGRKVTEHDADWNFAWAYMAGISYRLLGNAHVDLSYRHINMGDVSTGTDAFGNQLNFHKLSADEVRVGFRYVLD